MLRARTLVLDALAPARCAGCGAAGAALCEECVGLIVATVPPVLAGAAAAFEYEGLVRRVMHHGKFRDCRGALRALAWLGAERLEPPPGAVVTPVPLSVRRTRERGYNQAEVVARALAGFHRLPVAPLLERVRDTPAQSTLHRTARQANVAGAFAASAWAAGATVWLVDDVRTTGATTGAARDTLLAAGAARVDIAVLAAVP